MKNQLVVTRTLFGSMFLPDGIAFCKMDRLKLFDFLLLWFSKWYKLAGALHQLAERVKNWDFGQTWLNFSSHKLQIQWPQSKLKMNLSNSSKVNVQILQCFEKTFAGIQMNRVWRFSWVNKLWYRSVYWPWTIICKLDLLTLPLAIYDIVWTRSQLEISLVL